MRYIFVDEAGTSDREPVTVVVGLIADADHHVMNAEALAREVIGGVPPHHQEDFVFHAKQVFGDRKYREGWSMNDRLLILRQMMKIPRRIGMAVVVSVHWRRSVDFKKYAAQLNVSESQYEHFFAFLNCLAVADRNIRQNARPREVASVVAEDVQEMRGLLKQVPYVLQAGPIHLPPEMMRETSLDKAVGFNTQSGELRNTRIRNSVHFVEKAEDPLVQVADACAYGFRRYFAGEKFGPEFVEAILGHRDAVSQFAPPGGSSCRWFGPRDN